MQFCENKINDTKLKIEQINSSDYTKKTDSGLFFDNDAMEELYTNYNASKYETLYTLNARFKQLMDNGYTIRQTVRDAYNNYTQIFLNTPYGFNSTY